MHTMKFVAAAVALAASVSAAHEKGTFAVMRFHGKQPLFRGRGDPVVNPGVPSPHHHTVQGANGFRMNSTGQSLLETSTCSTAKIKADKSAYWMGSLFFHDKEKNTYDPVPLGYMNVYYFFDKTNDDIQPFPVGLHIVSGDASKRTPPETGNLQLDPSKGTIQPAQITCPRLDATKNLLAYPAGSDGSSGGIPDSGDKGRGAGFPFLKCDGLYSPLRVDLHFPSCYDPTKALTDYKINMKWPSPTGNGNMDCPKGTIHVPHLFYEMYWDTPKFNDRWTAGQGYQPFVFSNGDNTGFSTHGDFQAAWEPEPLKTFIDTCDAGTKGFDKCPIIPGGLWEDTGDCFLEDFIGEKTTNGMTSLPGNNQFFTFGASAASAPPAQDPPKQDPPQQDPPQQAPPKQDPPKQDPPKQDPPKQDPPKQDPPKEEPPKFEPPKIGIPKPTEAAPPAPTVDAPPAPVTLAPTVVATTNALGEPTLVTTWETVTQWLTVTVYDDEVGASPTPAPKAKRHEHHHLLRHRGHRGSHLHRR
jgi:hypothetical protein